MTTRRLLALVLMVGLLIIPLSVFAQDGEGSELEEFVSEDELLSVRRPADWIETELPGFPFPSIAFLNTEEASGRVASEEDFAPGDKGFFAAILPLDVFAQFGAAPPENPTITELGDFVAGIFGSPAEDATEEEIAAAKVGQAEEVELSEGVTAAQVEVSSLYEDDVYFIRDLGNGLVGLVVTAAATGEMDDAQIEVGRQAAASLNYEGTAEDIMAAMMAPPEVQESDVDPASLDGNALVDERCTVCHTRERIDAAEKDLAGWTATVDRMISYGAQLDSAERLAVIHFLAGVPLEGEAGTGETGAGQMDGDDGFDEYVSEDGLLTLSYPAGWIANPSTFLYGAELVNSQELMEAMQSEEGPEGGLPSGSVVASAVVVSIDNFNMFGMPVEAGMSLEEVAQIFLDFIAAPQGPPGGEGAEGEAESESEGAEEETEGEAEGEAESGEEGPGMQMEPPVVGEIQSIEFADGRQAVWARVEYPGESDDIYVLFEAGEGLYVVFNYFTAPGELTDEQIATGVRIAESVQFTGTADDLAMPGPEIEQSDVDPSTLDGNALVDERCTVCHTRERIDAQDKDEAGWTATVDRMIGYGAQLDSAERQAVIDYLVATH